MKPRRLISVAHSYVVTLNRRLAHEIARTSGGGWEVTAVAPTYFHGGHDLRPVTFERGDAEPCAVEPLPAYFTRSVHAFLYGPRLRQLLSQPADLVHCWEEPYVLAGAQVAWWTPPARPFVFWTAQNLSKRYPPPFNFVERYCVDRCAGWMACGQSTLAAMLPRGFDRRPHRIVPLGVDVEHFRPDATAGAAVRRELGWSEPGPPVVGFLGRLVAEKGVGFLAEALDRLASPWRALIVGAGPLETRLREWADRHGDRVRLCTGVRHADVPRHLNAIDVLCAPSRTTPRWREQFGRMLVEAFACGVPVLGSDSGEIPHVIGDAGLVAPENNVAAWEAALGQLIDSPALRADLAARGLDRARAHYAWAAVARQHIDFFQQILDGSAR